MESFKNHIRKFTQTYLLENVIKHKIISKITLKNKHRNTKNGLLVRDRNLQYCSYTVEASKRAIKLHLFGVAGKYKASAVIVTLAFPESP